MGCNCPRWHSHWENFTVMPKGGASMDEFHAHIREMSLSPTQAIEAEEKPFVDYWGEEWVSPKKERRDMKSKSLLRGEQLKAGPLFKSVNSVPSMCFG